MRGRSGSKATIAQQRLANQRVTQHGQRDPAKLVAWLGAVQAQEFGPAKWGLGLRLSPGISDATIQRAFDAGRILRTHVMRPTWHFVTPADIGWMVELTGASVHRRMATYDRQLGLDASIFRRAARLCERVLRDRNFLTREELGTHFAAAGVPGSGWALGHIALYIEAEGVICSGPRRGKQSTYALLAERAPTAVRLSREEALGELARRYFRSHGPATLRDFVWWSGLTTPDAKRGLEMIRARQLKVADKSYWTLHAASGRPRRQPAHLLPVYDEYLVAYRDRRAVPHGPSMVRARSGGYTRFQHALVIKGQVAGTWRGVATRAGVDVNLAPLRPLTTAETRAVRREVARYERFLGVPVSLSR
ncbi:MAG TPA: winged helix DNA-binding domain-containing protein [Gemmatimonadales bacterium]|nr:winged helix DNA-binding domain-containing protein [Gemmatimonadales bacterium]